ncbi:hypothetical protein JD844_025865 [Phrynosoma platyrhinos]|uniref:Treslin n=1 Tax=Phrynosoma platyrhinos TaxID=52577 RepID=A0ABQ7T0K0_PHRPL|nr:hypothetical protein JD844_025865 [Phrynosoma platyrhinos]
MKAEIQKPPSKRKAYGNETKGYLHCPDCVGKAIKECLPKATGKPHSINQRLSSEWQSICHDSNSPRRCPHAKRCANETPTASLAEQLYLQYRKKQVSEERKGAEAEIESRRLQSRAKKRKPAELSKYVCIAMEALDQLLMACHCQSINLFVESFLKMFVKFANIEEDTPSYHRSYDFFVSRFSEMCHSSHDDMDIRTKIRMSGIKGLQGVVRKTVNDELQANIWDPQHMDKIVPSLLFNLQHVEETESRSPSPLQTTEKEKENPAELAERCLRELLGRAAYGNIKNAIKPVLIHLDNHSLWEPKTFAIRPTVLEVFNTLLRQLRLSIDYALTGSYDCVITGGTKIIKEHEERMFQEAVIKTTGSVASPDCLELVFVPVSVDEADENLEDEKADFRILHQRCREQPVQEGAGKGRQHVAALETSGDLRDTVFMKKHSQQLYRHIYLTCKEENNSRAHYEALYALLALISIELANEEVVVDLIRLVLAMQVGPLEIAWNSLNLSQSVLMHKDSCLSPPRPTQLSDEDRLSKRKSIGETISLQVEVESRNSPEREEATLLQSKLNQIFEITIRPPPSPSGTITAAYGQPQSHSIPVYEMKFPDLCVY